MKGWPNDHCKKPRTGVEPTTGVYVHCMHRASLPEAKCREVRGLEEIRKVGRSQEGNETRGKVKGIREEKE